MRSLHLARQISLTPGILQQTLQLHQRDLARYQEDMATGLRIHRPSDDASGFARARKLEVITRRYDQYERSLNGAQAWVTYTQAALDDLAELFTSAYEEGVQAANDTLGAEDREALATSLEALFDEVIDVLNTRVGDEYLFAGTNTTTKPFERDGAGTADASGVTYYGNAQSRVRAVGPDLNLAINVTGSRVHDTGAGFTITEALQGLIDAVRTNDAAQITTALDDVIQARDHLLDAATEAGTVAHRLDQAAEHLANTRLEVERQRSATEDADLAETITNLQRSQTSLQATLQVLATLKQTSLLDFLR